jgi:hypothetical protein
MLPLVRWYGWLFIIIYIYIHGLAIYLVVVFLVVCVWLLVRTIILLVPAIIERSVPIALSQVGIISRCTAPLLTRVSFLRLIIFISHNLSILLPSSAS